MTIEPAEVFELSGDQGIDRVVDRLTHMVEAGRGWLNLHPGVRDDELPPPRTSLFDVFSGRGPDIPECTVLPGSTSRSGRKEPLSVGVRHSSGPKAADRLRDQGWPVPPAWVVTQDHPKRGLVAAVPDSADLTEVVEWLMGAGERLSVVPTTGWWHVRIYR